jgi:hypothetical protein
MEEALKDIWKYRKLIFCLMLATLAMEEACLGDIRNHFFGTLKQPPVATVPAESGSVQK